MHILFSLFIILNLTIISGQANSTSCVNEIVGNQPIYQHLKSDIDGDSFVEDLVVYGKEKSAATNTTAELRFLIAGYDPQRNCAAHIDTELDTVEPNHLTVHTLEIAELTGSSPPEIHLAYDVDRQSKRSSRAMHYIFSYVNNSWEKVFVSGNCLHMNYFEFQDNPQTQTTNIYTENDPYCDDPWPSQYAGHALFSWDGEQFVLNEQGDNYHSLPAISIWQQIIPVIPYIFLMGLPISAFAFGFFKQFIKPKQNK